MEKYLLTTREAFNKVKRYLEENQFLFYFSENNKGFEITVIH